LAGFVAVIVAISVAACGTPSEDDGTASGADEYVVGYQAPLSGDLSFLGTGNLGGLESYFDQVNSEGGINGRQVKVISQDDMGAVDTAVTKFKELVRSGALVVGGFPISTVNQGVFQVAAKEEVPMIGYGINTDEFVTPPNPWAFATAGTARTFVSMMNAYVESSAPKRGLQEPKVAVLAVDTAASKEVRDLVAAASDEAGWQLTDSEFIPLTATDANAQMAKIAQSKPDYVFLWTASPLLPMIANGAKANGLDSEDVQIVGADFADNEAIMSQLGIPNYYYDQINLWSQAKDGATAPMQAAAKKFGHGEELGESYFTDGWVEAEIIAAALDKCGDDCSGKSVSEALEETTVGDAGGLAGPDVGFSADSHEAYTHQRVVHFVPGKDVAVPVTPWIEWKEHEIHAEEGS